MIRTHLVPVLAAGALLVGTANLGAYAATGGPLLLGKSNTATKTTKLKTTGNGPALKLKSKAGKAPFSVSNETRVKKLNADLVDGLDSSELQTKAYRYELSGSTAGSVLRFAFPGLPPGRYVANMAVSLELTNPASFVGCVFDRGAPFANPQFAGLGINGSAGYWYVNGGGLLDTTSGAHTLSCQAGSPGFSVPASPSPAHVVLTPVDTLANSPSVGTPAETRTSGLGG